MTTSEQPLQQPPVVRPARERRPHIVGPVILIGLGALLLAQNLGWLSGSIWPSIWRFWPLLLILVGVELACRDMGRLGTLIIACVAVLAVGTVAYAATGGVPRLADGSWPLGSLGGAKVDRIAEELGGIRQATVGIRHNAGRLQVAALPAASSRLVEADLSHPEDSTIYRRLDRNGDSAELRLREPDRSDFPFVANDYVDDWTVRLSPQIPLAVQLESGASELDLDLRDLLVTQLTVKAGASAVNVTLPKAAGRTSATIKAGAAGVDVTIPEGVAASIRVQGGLSGTTVDQSRFPRTGDYYQSPDFATAANRVDLFIETGVGGVTVR